LSGDLKVDETISMETFGDRCMPERASKRTTRLSASGSGDARMGPGEPIMLQQQPLSRFFHCHIHSSPCYRSNLTDFAWRLWRRRVYAPMFLHLQLRRSVHSLMTLQ